MSSFTHSRDRTIRVFVSSTFRDMQAERDELVLRVFPQLRHLCDERSVTWGEIDLRWGITEEQSQRGEVLPICLEEIKRCWPYFIGLLGERYGWTPETISATVLEREPWIGVHASGPGRKSVTELEIRHGVLNNPDMAGNAFFYFRDPSYIETVPSEAKKDFLSEGADSAQKLKLLKEEIRLQHRAGKLQHAPHEDYPNAKTLGELVLADFTALINSLYPEGDKPSLLERERMDHEAFARGRAGVYIGRQEYFDRLDGHVASDTAPLVVIGESGSGKSALLANWALGHRKQHPEDFLLLHFIGSSPDSANATAMLRRIMLELKQEFTLADEIPSQPDKVREEFPNWVTKVASGRRIVLVLDALNQLEDVDNAPDLGWLPRVFPKYCRVIVSTLPGRSLTAIEQRGWLQVTTPLKVLPLDEAERRKLIHDFLKQHTRDLGTNRTNLVVAVPQAANPLYLRVLLDELRVFGLHDQLNDRIDWYLEAQDSYELYRKVIARWEEAYAEGTGLVRDTLSLLWAARRGLSETEVLEALGQHGRPLSRAVWSPLFLAMSDALVSRSGLLTFAHDFLRMAARDAYLPDEPQQQGVHRRLAGYFQQQSSWGERKLDELPWQLAAAHDWQALHDALTERPCFVGLQRRNQYELLGYWRRLEPQFHFGVSYPSAFARWSQAQSDMRELAVVANDLGVFLNAGASHAAAEPLLRRAIAIDEQSYGAEHPSVARDLNNLANVLQATNRLAEAEPLMRRALAIHEEFYGAEHPSVATSLTTLANLLQDTNRLAEAELLIRRGLAIDERSYGSEHPDVAIDLSNLANLLYATGRLAEAEPLMRRALAIGQQSYGAEHPNIARRLNNLAALLQATNRFAEAEPLMRRAVAIDEQSYGAEHPNVAIPLNNLAALLQATNRFAEAEPLMRRAVAIDEQSYGAEHPNVAKRLNNLATLLFATNRLAEAKGLMPRGVGILLKFTLATGHQHPDLQVACDNYAGLLAAMGDSDAEVQARMNELLGPYGMSRG